MTRLIAALENTENIPGAWIACWLERGTRDRKVGEFEPRQEQRKNFLPQSQLCVLALIRRAFHPLVFNGVARKRPRSFCQKCRWQVTPKQAYTLDPTKSEWADYAAVQAVCGNLSGNEPTHNSSGNTRSQSSQLAEPMWTNLGLESGISKLKFIST